VQLHTPISSVLNMTSC